MSKDVKEQLEAWATEGKDGKQVAPATPEREQRPPVTAAPEEPDGPQANSN